MNRIGLIFTSVIWLVVVICTPVALIQGCNPAHMKDKAIFEELHAEFEQACLENTPEAYDRFRQKSGKSGLMDNWELRQQVWDMSSKSYDRIKQSLATKRIVTVELRFRSAYKNYSVQQKRIEARIIKTLGSKGFRTSLGPAATETDYPLFRNLGTTPYPVCRASDPENVDAVVFVGLNFKKGWSGPYGYASSSSLSWITCNYWVHDGRTGAFLMSGEDHVSRKKRLVSRTYSGRSRREEYTFTETESQFVDRAGRKFLGDFSRLSIRLR